MLRRLTGYFESRIDVFAPFDEHRVPPDRVWPFMWYFLKDIRGWLAAIMLSGLCFSAIDASIYLIVGWFVDLVGKKAPQAILDEHGWQLLGAAVVVGLVRPALFALNQTINDIVVIPQISNRIRWRNHVYTLGHALSYFQNEFAGRLAARVIQAGPAVRGATVMVISELWYAAIFATVMVGFFGTVSGWLMLPVLVWLAAYVGLAVYFVPRAMKRSEANSLARSATTGRIVDAYTNILTVKLFARGDAERFSVRESIGRWNEVFLELMRLILGVGIVLQFINGLLLLAIASLSFHLWAGEAMTAGSVAAAVTLTLRLIQMSGWLLMLLRDVYDNIGTVQESMRTIAQPHVLKDARDAKELVVRQGEIAFEHVRFGYGAGKPVFEDLSLRIAPGEKIGIVGPSGAGKSTLVSLLLRLFDVSGGRVAIDGQDIAGVTQDSLRRAVGVVTQDSSLLHRSIHDNIAYGRPGAGADEVEAAARQAAAHEFILGLNDPEGREGYESRVGERGVKLSGGQRQRITVARVLLKDAPILVLDEATSALDSEIEAAIQDQLDRLMQGKTVLVIAHRLSTIARLDRLIVLDRGRIVEEGRHADLVAAGGLYARLWARQSGGFLGEEAGTPAAVRGFQGAT